MKEIFIERAYKVTNSDGAVFDNDAIVWTTTAGEISPAGVLRISQDAYAKGGTVTATIPSYGKVIKIAFGLNPEDYAEGLTIVDPDGITVVPTEVADKKLYVLYAKTSDDRILDNRDVVWTSDYGEMIEGTLLVNNFSVPGTYHISCYAKTNPASSASVTFSIPEVSEIVLKDFDGTVINHPESDPLQVLDAVTITAQAYDQNGRILKTDEISWVSNYKDMFDGLLSVNMMKPGLYSVSAVLKSNPAVNKTFYFRIGTEAGLEVTNTDGTEIPASGITLPRNHQNKNSSLSFTVKYRGLPATNCVWEDTFQETAWNSNTVTFKTSEPIVSGTITCRIPNTDESVIIPISYMVQGLNDQLNFAGGAGIYSTTDSLCQLSLVIPGVGVFHHNDNIPMVQTVARKTFVKDKVVGYLKIANAIYIGVNPEDLDFHTSYGNIIDNNITIDVNCGTLAVISVSTALKNKELLNISLNLFYTLMHPVSYTFDPETKYLAIRFNTANMPTNLLLVCQNERVEILNHGINDIYVWCGDVGSPHLLIRSTEGNYIMNAQFSLSAGTFIDYLNS